MSGLKSHLLQRPVDWFYGSHYFTDDTQARRSEASRLITHRQGQSWEQAPVTEHSGQSGQGLLGSLCGDGFAFLDCSRPCAVTTVTHAVHPLHAVGSGFFYTVVGCGCVVFVIV